jgi:hypothetical protein
MSDWEVRNHQTAQVNCYGYGGMFNVSKAHLHQNVRSYFDQTSLDFGDNFATHPPEWSSVRSFIATAKHSPQPESDTLDRFPVARGDLIDALICSDYSRLGWCQAPTNLDWKLLLGPGSKNGLDLVIKGSTAEQVALRAVDCGYAAKGLLGKLRIDLGADIVKEFMVDRV